jgi:hypothetical protein
VVNKFYHKSFSTSDHSSKEEEKYNKIHYTGHFGSVLKLLKRLSIGSALISTGILVSSFWRYYVFPSLMLFQPVMMYLHSTTPDVGKCVIIGTAVFMSVGSTVFLKKMSYPYVTLLTEIKPLSSALDDRRFEANRINLFGFEYSEQFSLSEVKGIKVTQHPFANFEVNGSFYFIFLKLLEDENLRQRLQVSFQDTKKN